MEDALKHSALRLVPTEKQCSAMVLDSEELNSVLLDEKPPSKERKTKSLDQLGEKQLKYQTDAIWKKVEAYAEENEESTLRVIAMFLKNVEKRVHVSLVMRYGNNELHHGKHHHPDPRSSSSSFQRCCYCHHGELFIRLQYLTVFNFSSF